MLVSWLWVRTAQVPVLLPASLLKQLHSVKASGTWTLPVSFAMAVGQHGRGQAAPLTLASSLPTSQSHVHRWQQNGT
jgi:hypothetical protein